MNEYKKLFKNFFVFFLGDFGSKVLSFLMVPFYTGILSTVQYGEIDLIMSSINFIIPLITFNCSDAVFRFIMSKNEDKKAVLTTGMIIPITGLFIFLLSLPFVKNYLTTYSILLYLITITNIYYGIISNYTKAVGNVKLVSTVGFTHTFLFICFNIIALKYLSLGTIGYLLSSILSQLISIIILVVIQKIWRELNICKVKARLMKSMIKYSLPLIPTNLCWWIIMLSDRYMINWMLGTQFTGLYAIANKVPTILQMLLTIFMQAWQISATSIYEESEEKVKLHFQSTLKYSQGIVFICTSMLIIFTQLIMIIIAKNDFYLGWSYAPFLIISISFSFVNGINTAIYTVYKKNISQFYTTFFAAIFNIILNLLLIKNIGVIGATFASCCSYALIMFIRLKDTEKLLKFNRNYRLIISNSFIIIIQAFMYIYVENFMIKYIMQIICLIVIIFNNRYIFNLVMKRRTTNDW